ncbi:uncharacterized protein [Choristoneura fumiferana]|uniref:uncharacterized protein n=1 Tax=Choristoneura fumiferana TaxID=7141 RepID=UPI003D158F78
MGWNIVAVFAVVVSVSSGRCVRRPQTTTIPTIQPVQPIQPIIPTVVDGAVVKSLIDTIQLFIVSDLLEETLPGRDVIVTPYPISANYIEDCDILPYDIVYDEDCPDFVTAFVPREPCVKTKPLCVNFGLNEELILPPLAPELPCGLGYLPGGLPVVAKAFAPCPKCSGCGCTCSTAALPICSPYSCAALATPLCPDLSPFVKPVIL